MQGIFQKKCLLKFLTDITQGNLSEIDKNGFSKSDFFKNRLSHYQKEIRDHKFLYDKLKNLQYGGLSFYR